MTYHEWVTCGIWLHLCFRPAEQNFSVSCKFKKLSHKWYRDKHRIQNEAKKMSDRSWGKDFFPYLKVPFDVRCLGMKWNHWNKIGAELPTIYDSKRFLFLLCTNFISTSYVFWMKSKHHIQHILGLFSILFSPISKTKTPQGRFQLWKRVAARRVCFISIAQTALVPFQNRFPVPVTRKL